MYFPLMISLKNRKIVIIGGGKVALRKLEQLLPYEGHITLVAPFFHEEIQARKEEVSLLQGEYEEKYIEGAFLVIAGTNHKGVNKKIEEACEKKGILCNRVDQGEDSLCIFPATMRRGHLVISVSTEGRSPVVAKGILRQIEATFDGSWEEKIEKMGSIRDMVLTMESDTKKRQEILSGLFHKTLKELEKIEETYRESKK